MPYDSDTATIAKADASAKPAAADFVSQVTSTPFGEATLLRCEPSPPFFLLHYAQNWEIASEGLDGPTWLPEIQRDPVEPGCNQMRTRKSNEPVSEMFALAHQYRTRNGATILPQRIKLDGFAYDTYLQSVPCAHPRTGIEGVLYFDRWETPIPPEPGRRVKFRRDRAEYNRWRFALVEQGVIAPPDPLKIDQKRARAVYHVERREVMTDLPEEVRKRVVDEAKAKAEVVATAVVPEPAVMVRAPTEAQRPSVESLRKSVATIEDVGVLRALLVGETRVSAVRVIEARIKVLAQAPTP